MAERDKKQPSREVASAYVWTGIYGKGGWREAWGGLRHKTVPFLIGCESSITLGWIVSKGIRFLLFVSIALYPLLVRKALVAKPAVQSVKSVQAGVLPDGFSQLLNSISNPEPVDYALGFLALVLAGVPKVFEIFSRKSVAEQHSPYYDLAAAVDAMPPAAIRRAEDSDVPIRLALSALRDEMSQLIGDEAHRRVTDVTLLEFCDPEGRKMQVRARTAAHEPVRRPVESEKFVAYYVAMEGRSLAEHDFKSASNPFPNTRLTVVGSPSLTYRSVLYLPIMSSENVENEAGVLSPAKVVDSCLGVICVHSSKPYRFWRWGDHNKDVGGFSDVAFERSMPYIALVKRLLESTAPKVRLGKK